MLQPVRTKFRKAFKGRIHGKATEQQTELWQFGLKAMSLRELSETNWSCKSR